MPSAPTWSGATGEGCAQTASASFAHVGWWTGYSNGPGWSTHQGGSTANGCSGRFAAMPMSGDANHDTSGTYSQWSFATGPVVTGFCSIDVFLPDDGVPTDVGGHPATYEVLNSGTVHVAYFQIDQTTHRGQWYQVPGTFPVAGGKLAVQLHSRGVTDGNPQPMLAADQVAVTCHG